MTDTLPHLDPSDPYARSEQTFPHLSEEMAARVASYGTQESIPAGTLLYKRGDRNTDFFLVLEGTVEIYDHGKDNTPVLVTLHSARQFSGELDLFSNRQVLVSARANTDCTVVRIKRPDFRRLVSAEPDIGEIIMRAFILRRVGLIRHEQGAVALIGQGHDAATLQLQRFLERNGYPYRLLDTAVDPDAGGFMECFGLKPEELPVVIYSDEDALRNPTITELADVLGVFETIDPTHVYDLAIVGAGPAGLAAAVYAASEGLDTIVVESLAPGGQAGTSSKIENYLGFPTGISGRALAGRAQVQAQKFGARLAVSRSAVGLECDSSPYSIRLNDDSAVSCRAIVIATGARYRKLDLPRYDEFEGQGIHYAATTMEAKLCTDEEIIVVGGGNSAGQAAVFLSRTAHHVHIMVRSGGLAATMSSYLIDRILSSPRITLHTHTEITTLEGDRTLREVTWTNRKSGAAECRPIRNVFVMIGAEPNTEWLNGCVQLCPKGFVATGKDVHLTNLSSPYQTSRAGIYAVGDVRGGSVKRVAAGVGDGSVVVQDIHRYLSPEGV